jgi:glycerol-3-phosphate dehydrogenase subunit B
VTVVSAGTGASGLSGGAIDDVPWEELARVARVLGETPLEGVPALAPEVAAFTGELGLWDVPSALRPWIATIAGCVRPARGRDRALLDLGGLRDGKVLLPRVDRAGWDADSLARVLTASEFARGRRLGFWAVDAPVLRFDEEHRIGDADLAARHDDETRLGWLAARLRDAVAKGGAVAAVLLGPWLGVTAPRAAALSSMVGLLCGEVMVGAGSPAGLRFESARDRMLQSMGVRRAWDRVTAVTQAETLSVALAGDDAVIVADAVVLAIGGIAAGGVVYELPEQTAGTGRSTAGKAPFRLSVSADVTLAAGMPDALGIASSLYGPELDRSTWPVAGRSAVLETVGVHCVGPRANERILAAGDVVAGRRRTVLEAIESGIAAGSAASALTK